MRINKLLLVSGLFFLVFISCKKGEQQQICVEKTVAEEKPTMTKYATDNAMNVTTDATGLMYEIVNAGTGATPAVSNSVTVKYTGKLLNGTVFDTNQQGVTFPLSSLIVGWQIGIPKIKAGGKMKMIVPSSLAYGCSKYIPQLAGQILYFDVELVSVQ